MSLSTAEMQTPETAGLLAEVEARKELRRAADRAELHVALHEMAEGLRGLIRVAPFASIAAAAALGMFWSRRRARRPLRK